MPGLILAPMDESGTRAFASWFENEELRRWYSAPNAPWFENVTQEPRACAWRVYEAGLLSGIYS